MKQIILLLFLLVPAFLFAQYPATGNKSRLGYQTTGDGLIWRGVAADTAIKPRTTANAYFQLDTVNRILRRYIATQGSWQVVGGGTSIDSLVYSTIKGLNDSIQAEKQTLSFASPLLGISDGNNVDLSPLLTGYVTGSGTNNRVPKWSALTNLTDSNVQDDGTSVSILNSKPFQLGQWTTAGRPSGVNGYKGRNTTTGFDEGYFTSQWENYITSTGAANGQLSIFSSAGKTYGTNNLFWDNSNTRLGIGTSSPVSGITLFGATNQIKLAGSVNNTNNQSLVFSHGILPNSYISSGIFGVPAGSFSFGNIIFAISPTNNVDANPATSGHSVLTLTSSAVTTNKPFTVTSNSTAAVSVSIGNGNTNNAGEKALYFVTSTAAQTYAGLIARPAGSNGNFTYVGMANRQSAAATGADTRLGIYNNGNIWVGALASPSYQLHVMGTDAIGVPRGTVAQRPTIASSTTPFRYSTDSITLEYGESVGTWRQIATRAYARSLFSATTWLKPALEAGNVTISNNSNTLTLTGSTLQLLNQSGSNGFVMKGETDYEGYNSIQTKSTNFYHLVDRRTGTYGLPFNLKYGFLNGNFVAGDYNYDVVGLDTINKFISRVRGPFFGNFGYIEQVKVNANIGSYGFQIIKNNSGSSAGRLLTIASSSDVTFGNHFNADGTLQLSLYGTSATTAAALSKTESGYLASFATDGTALSKPDNTERYNTVTSTTSPVTLSNTVSDNLINQGSTQATFTLNFPASPVDGQVLKITYNNAITTLTLDGNGNTIVGSAVTTGVAGSQRAFKFYTGIGWIKLY